jgi:DnaJ family protein B protein 5
MGSSFGTSPNFSYTFHGDPRATFAEFFGTANPFESFFGSHDIFNNDNDVHHHDSLHAHIHADPFASLGGLHGGLHSPGGSPGGVGLGRTPFRNDASRNSDSKD